MSYLNKLRLLTVNVGMVTDKIHCFRTETAQNAVSRHKGFGRQKAAFRDKKLVAGETHVIAGLFLSDANMIHSLKNNFLSTNRDIYDIIAAGYAANTSFARKEYANQIERRIANIRFDLE